MRGFLVALLAAVGLVLLPLADLAVWVQRQLLDTSSFTALADDVVDEPDVQAALADEVGQRLVVRFPGLRGNEPLIRQATTTVAASDAFRVVFDEAVGQMHQQLVDREDRLVLDLDAAVPLIRNQLPPDVASRIPRPTGLTDVEVVQRDDAPAVWSAVELVQRAVVLFPIVSLLFLVAAILLATRRAVALMVIGGIAAAEMAVVVLVVQFARSLLESFSGDPVQQQAFEAAGGVVLGSFATQTLVVVVLALAAVVGGVVATNMRSSRRRPAEWA